MKVTRAERENEFMLSYAIANEVLAQSVKIINFQY